MLKQPHDFLVCTKLFCESCDVAMQEAFDMSGEEQVIEENDLLPCMGCGGYCNSNGRCVE